MTFSTYNFDETFKTLPNFNLLNQTLVLKLELNDDQSNKTFTINREKLALDIINQIGIKSEDYQYFGWYSKYDLNILFNFENKLNAHVGSFQCKDTSLGNFSARAYKLRKQGSFVRIKNLPPYADKRNLEKMFSECGKGLLKVENLKYSNPKYVNGKNYPGMFEAMLEPSENNLEQTILDNMVPNCMFYRGRWYPIELQGQKTCFCCYKRGDHVKNDCPGHFCKDCCMAHDTKLCPKTRSASSYASRTANTQNEMTSSYSIPENLENNSSPIERRDSPKSMNNLTNVLPYSFSSEENSLQIDAFSNTPNLHKELIDAGVNSFEAPLRDKSRVQSSPKSSDEEEDCTSQHIHSNQEAQKKK